MACSYGLFGIRMKSSSGIQFATYSLNLTSTCMEKSMLMKSGVCIQFIVLGCCVWCYLIACVQCHLCVIQADCTDWLLCSMLSLCNTDKLQ